MRVIGLTGKARAGKDTACGFIKDWCFERNIAVERAAFADKLKVSAARSLGLVTETTEQCVSFCDRLKQTGATVTVGFPVAPGYAAETELQITGREFLQFYGTEAHRDVFGADFWVDALLVRREAVPDDFGKLLVISDVRFEDEARAIHNAGGEVWEVHRNDLVARLQDSLNSHSSEVGFPADLIDRVIPNDHDLAYFEREVRLACVEAGIG